MRSGAFRDAYTSSIKQQGKTAECPLCHLKALGMLLALCYKTQRLLFKTLLCWKKPMAEEVEENEALKPAKLSSLGIVSS